MTEDEARKVIKYMGWTSLVRRRRHGTPYLYALRRVQSRLTERYIAPLSKLPELTEADIIEKLTASQE
jgi:hypothetical protein